MKNITMFVMKELKWVQDSTTCVRKGFGSFSLKGVFPIYSNLVLSWIATQDLKCIYFFYHLLVQIPYIYIVIDIVTFGTID